MINLSICFYQWPEALVDIKGWESRVYDKITAKRKTEGKESVLEDKKILDGQIIEYFLGSSEYLICIPIHSAYLVSYDTVLSWAYNFSKNTLNSKNITIKYNKTIVFGKLSTTDCDNILKIMFKFEKG